MPEPTKPPRSRPVMPPDPSDEFQEVGPFRESGRRREPPRPYWTPFQWGLWASMGAMVGLFIWSFVMLIVFAVFSGCATGMVPRK